jgi:hypothetical protein
VTKLRCFGSTPLLTPLHTSAPLCFPLLPEPHRRPPPAPICPSTLDPGVPLCAPPFPISPEIPIGLEMCSLGPYSPLPSLRLEAMVERSCPACYNTYSSLFSVVGLDSALCSLDAPLFFVNDLLSPLRLAPWSSFLRNNLCALSEHMGRRRGCSTNVPI